MKSLFQAVAIVLMATVITVTCLKRYEGYQVIRFFPSTDDQVKVLLVAADDPEFDWWVRPFTPGHHADLSVPPNKVTFISDIATENAINSTLLIDDLQKLIDGESAAIKVRTVKRVGARFDAQNFFNDYQSLSSINAFMDQIVQKWPQMASVIKIGSSFENKDLRVLKIGTQPGRRRSRQSDPNSSSSKPALWIDAGIHAREWVAPPAALYIAWSLVSEYDKDSEVKRLVDMFDWYIMPSANPDGYVYSHESDRMWRKTRSKSPFTKCRGVDPNRNFDFHWNSVGTSSNPCDDTYAGPRAFSELETQAMSKFLLKNKNSIKMYLSLHAYSQMWLTPWGFTSALPADYQKLMSKARAATRSIAKVYGTKFETGSSTNLLYAAAGGSDDWAHGVAGIPYAYTVELRPSSYSRRGFMLPPSQIRPTAVETWTGIKALAVELANDFKRGKL